MLRMSTGNFLHSLGKDIWKFSFKKKNEVGIIHPKDDRKIVVFISAHPPHPASGKGFEHHFSQ